MNQQDAAKAIRNTMLGNPVAAWVRGLVVAALFGAIAFFVYRWIIVNFGAVMAVLPGWMLGLGFIIGARRSLPFAGIVLGVLGLAFGIFCDARTYDPPIGFFEYFTRIKQIPEINLILIALGGIAAGWFARGNKPQ
ncbi:MAG: hypothetical protein AAF939_00760 [Planctomycetota bacterium]